MKKTVKPTTLLAACHPASFHAHAQVAGMSVAAKERRLHLALNLHVLGFENQA